MVTVWQHSARAPECNETLADRWNHEVGSITRLHVCLHPPPKETRLRSLDYAGITMGTGGGGGGSEGAGS